MQDFRHIRNTAGYKIEYCAHLQLHVFIIVLYQRSSACCPVQNAAYLSYMIFHVAVQLLSNKATLLLGHHFF